MRQTSSLLAVVPDVNMLKDEIHNIVMDLPRGEQILEQNLVKLLRLIKPIP